MTNRLAALAFASLTAFATAPALAADFLDSPDAGSGVQEVEVNAPPCDDPKVLAEVEDQFEYGAPRVIPAPLSVAEFSDLRERAYFPRVANYRVERRYCSGTALIDGVDVKDFPPRTTVYYVIEYPLGFASVGWKAEGCFLGYDKWKVYGANCESLRRFQ